MNIQNIVAIIFLLYGTKGFTQVKLSEQKLVNHVIFNEISVDLPESIVFPDSKEKIEALNSLKIFPLSDKDDLINIKIRVRDEIDLELIRELHESMTSSFYNGKIDRSEYKEINGMTFYIIEVTGYWNGSEILESWMKFFTVSNHKTYQMLFRYPNSEKEPSKEVRERIINSFTII